MTTRRAFLGTLAGGLLVAPGAAVAQPAGRVHRIGYLGPNSTTSPFVRRTIEAFQQGLRDFGWAEGRNIVVEYRFAEGNSDRLPGLAAELVRLKVDVVAAGPTLAAVAAKNATATIPIVIMGVGDPVGLGLVASLARPGGNITGLSFSVALETFTKELELLKEMVPKVRRVAVLSNPANPAQGLAIADLKVSARSLGVELQVLEARGPSDFDAAFAAMAKEHVGALLVVADSMFILHRARLIDLAARRRLPAAYGIRETAEAGGLMSYGPSTMAIWRRAAFFIDKILKGAKPADLPVEQPSTFELVINLKTAKALGLTIPQSLLLRANQVIE